MKFLEAEKEAADLITKACQELGYPDADPEVAPPPNREYGDLASAVSIRLGRERGEKPGDVSLKLAVEVSKHLKSTKYIGNVTPHRTGYLNFTLNYQRFFFDSISGVSAGNFGEAAKKGVTIAIEHTNVNPNKALHIGHARNLALGDSLVRIMRYLGYGVQALNYIDDSGAQVADVIVGFKFLGFKDTAPDGVKFDIYAGDSVYSKVTQEYERDPETREKQTLVLKEIERGEGEIAEYARSVVKRILNDQLQTCWRMGAAYDLLNWESQLVHSGMWEKMFEEMKQKGLVKFETEGENAGCWVIPDPDTDEQKVVVRSDGTIVYVAKDIPYAAWKIGLVSDPFGYEVFTESQPTDGRLYSTTLGGKKTSTKFGGVDRAISVIDTRQAYLQRIVGKVLEQVKGGSSERYVHKGYEVVALSKETATQMGFKVEKEFVHMSGRKGLYVNTDTVLDELKKKAVEETRRRNPQESQDWIDGVAETLAVAALRYDLLKQDPDKIIIFDLREALRLDGDTGPYLTYTYARARRILDKAAGRPRIDMASASKMTRPQEISLVKKLSSLDKAVGTAGEYLSPKAVAIFAHDLAASINEFYESVQVNREPDPDLRDARLALVDAASRVLAESMKLLGLPFRDRI